ncbi:MAG TPA: low molecular weight protein arginine phosphatase [Gemmataceae bacterium]
MIDAGPLPATDPPTEIRVGPGGWRVERAGAFPEEELRRRAALQIVFVCTGNTCRSPLAEALCKAALARRLGCPPEELPARGFDILSAGVAAYEGCPASPEAVAVAAELGADLRSHRSRAVSPELLVGADLLVAVGRSHREILRAVLGAEGGKVRLLCEDADVPDPIGGDREVYRACARTIADQVERLVSEWHSQ